jgi:sialic acid synthase SpsE
MPSRLPSIRIIAEIGSVHDGSFGNAAKLIEAESSATGPYGGIFGSR